MTNQDEPSSFRQPSQRLQYDVDIAYLYAAPLLLEEPRGKKKSKAIEKLDFEKEILTIRQTLEDIEGQGNGKQVRLKIASATHTALSQRLLEGNVFAARNRLARMTTPTVDTIVE